MSRGTRDTRPTASPFAYRSFTFYGSSFQYDSARFSSFPPGPTTPDPPKQFGFGLFPFRSPLLRKSRLLSLPSGTEMFHFPEFASAFYVFKDR